MFWQTNNFNRIRSSFASDLEIYRCDDVMKVQEEFVNIFKKSDQRY